jgi:hypothetical protein
MKQKNIVIVLIILFISLCGCAQSKPNKKVDVNAEVEVTNINQTKNISENDKTDNLEEDKYSSHISPLKIKSCNEYELKDEILNQIEFAKSDAGRSNGEYGMNKVGDIYKFLYFAVKIEGYELYCVLVSEASLSYRYVPTEKLDDFRNEKAFLSMSPNINIKIYRQDWFDNAEVAGTMKPKINEWGDLNEDGVVYFEESRVMISQMEDTILSIILPDYGVSDEEKKNDYEYLRDLAFEIIETSELTVLDNHIVN